MKSSTLRLGEKVGNGIVTEILNIGKGTRQITVTPTMYPNWKFKIHIRESRDGQFYYAGVSSNGQDLFVSETQKRKGQLTRTVNRIFPNVKIIDKTK